LALSAAAFADDPTSFVTARDAVEGQFQIDGVFPTPPRTNMLMPSRRHVHELMPHRYGIMDNWNVSATWGWERSNDEVLR
jgi:hypothetical protein